MKPTKLLIISLFLFSCKKDKPENPVKYGNITFYQSDYGAQQTYFYLDGQNKGLMHRRDTILSCGSNIVDTVYTFRLRYGKHTYFMFDAFANHQKFDLTVDSDCKVIKVPGP